MDWCVDSVGMWGLYTAHNAGGTPLAAVGFALKVSGFFELEALTNQESRVSDLCAQKAKAGRAKDFAFLRGLFFEN